MRGGGAGEGLAAFDGPKDKAAGSWWAWGLLQACEGQDSGLRPV